MTDKLPRVGSALLVRDEANRILLGKRNKDPQRGSWVIPGGKIHAFETIAEAAAREILEETGLHVEVHDQFRVYEIVNPPDEHRIVIYSWGTLVGGIPKASDDLSDLRFFSIDELGYVPTTPLVKRVLADAGLVVREAQALRRAEVQLNLFVVPVLIAGANEKARGRVPARPRTRRRRRRAMRCIDNIPLLFDDSLSS